MFKTLVDVFDGPEGMTALFDTISWQGQLWLVPRWQLGKTEGNRRPVRIVRPKLFRFERSSHPRHGEDYSLACVVPKAILDGEQVSGNGVEFEIVEDPEFESPVPSLQ